MSEVYCLEFNESRVSMTLTYLCGLARNTDGFAESCVRKVAYQTHRIEMPALSVCKEALLRFGGHFQCPHNAGGGVP